jgi:hypothetical protein
MRNTNGFLKANNYIIINSNYVTISSYRTINKFDKPSLCILNLFWAHLKAWRGGIHYYEEFPQAMSEPGALD